LQGVQLLLGSTEAREQTQNNLLEVTALLILNEVALYVQLYFLVLGARFRNLADPRMVKQLRYGWPLILIFLQAQGDEVLCIV